MLQLRRPAALQSREPTVTVQLDVGSIRWYVARDVLEELLAAGALTPRVWPNAAHCRPIKVGPHRRVWRLDAPTASFFVKHALPLGRLARLRGHVRPAAWREWRSIESVRGAGLPTARPVAIGCDRTTAQSILVTRAIDDARPLDEFLTDDLPDLPPRQQVVVRHRLASELGRLTAELHTAGLVHGDWHAGNVLVRPTPDGVRVWLIDVAAVHRVRWLTPRTIQRDLALWHHAFAAKASRTDRLRFAASYWHVLQDRARFPPFGWTLGAFVRRVEEYSRRATRRARRRRDRKWARGNRHVLIADAAGVACRGLAELGRPQLVAIRDGNLPAAVRLSGAVVSLRCVPLQPPAGSARSAWGGIGTARRAWEVGHALLRRGLDTPRPLACLDHSGPRTSLLLTESVPRSLRLDEFLAGPLTTLDRSTREHWLASLAQRLAALIAAMHAEGFDHETLSASNVQVTDDVTRGRIAMLGLEYVTPRRRLSRRRLVANLASLATSLGGAPSVRHAHRLRFLRGYLRQDCDREWKRLWRDVQRIVRRTSTHDEHGRSPVASRGWKVALLLAGLALGSCRSGGPQQMSLPARYSVVSKQLRIHSDVRLSTDHPLVGELTNLRDELAEALSLPPDGREVVVYLFDTEARYRGYFRATFPHLPARRAYFIGSPQRLAVYTFWSNRIREDLRHECTHGLLHASLAAVPLWLDEGLAEYFETSASNPARANAEYLRQLADEISFGWQPNLQRLELLEDVSQMQRVDYREAWAWAHFLLQGDAAARRELIEYIRALRVAVPLEPFSARLYRTHPDADVRLVRHLAWRSARGTSAGTAGDSPQATSGAVSGRP